MHSFTITLGIVVLVCGALAILFAHFPPAWVFFVQGIVIIGAVLLERYRYKPLATGAPQGNWVRTSERFFDDETGKPVTVWLDPETGERKYVAD